MSQNPGNLCALQPLSWFTECIQMADVCYSCHADFGANSEIVNLNPARSNSSVVLRKLCPRDWLSAVTYHNNCHLPTSTANLLSANTTPQLCGYHQMSHTDSEVSLLPSTAVKTCKYSRSLFDDIGNPWSDEIYRCFGNL
jgi:hypothetical protein